MKVKNYFRRIIALAVIVTMFSTTFPLGFAFGAENTATVQAAGSSDDLITLLQSVEKLLDKIASLDNDQIRTLINIGEEWSKLDVLTDAQKELLAQKGITTGENGEMTLVINTLKSQVYTDDQINTFRTDVQNRNLKGLAGLMLQIKNAFPASLKSVLAARGITTVQLLGVIVNFTNITFSQGMEINSKLKTDVDQILSQDGIYDSVDKQVLSSYGLNWENLNTLIGQLTPAQKSEVEAILEAFGQYVQAPQANPGAGTYWSAQNVTLQSPTVGAAVYYALDGDVLDASDNLNTNAQRYSSPVPVDTPGTTTINAVAVKDGVMSVMAGYTYTLKQIAAPQADIAPGSFTIPQVITLKSATEGATIYYTTDGSDPTTSGARESGPASGTLVATDQTITLRAVAVIEGTAGAVSDEFSGTYTIAPGVFDLEKASYAVAEDAGSLTVTVKRTGITTGKASVSYEALDGSAAAGEDYNYTKGTLAFADGETSKPINIGILNNDVFEPDQTFHLVLSDPQGGLLGDISETTITIADDDARPGSVSFGQADYSVDENAGTVTIAVYRAGGSDREVSVDYAVTAGTATADSDFTPDSGTLTFKDGEAVKPFTVSILDDNLYEDDETVNLALSNTQGGVALGAQATAVLTIKSEDVAKPGNLAFAKASLSVDENAGTVTVTVHRAGGTDNTVTVDYADEGGTATPGTDYGASSGTLTFESGATTPQTFNLSVKNDNQVEPDETIQLVLKNPSGGAELGAQNEMLIIIKNEDVEFSSTKVTASTSSGDVAYGDFNGDDLTDMVLAQYDGYAAVFLGKTDGSFQSKGSFQAISVQDTFPVVTGDFDSDGLSDLVVVRSGELKVLRSNGDGTFQAIVPWIAYYGWPSSAVSGDFDGNGLDDLAIADRYTSSVQVYLRGDDGASFREKVSYPVGSGSFAAGKKMGLIAGNFNGDAHADLAVANGNDQKVYILPGNGDGTFGQAKISLAGGEPLSLTAGDFDGNGKLDLATHLVNGKVGLMMGNGDGTFGEQRTFSIPSDYNSIATGDFDADGYDDIVIGGYGGWKVGNYISVLLADGDGTFLGEQDGVVDPSLRNIQFLNAEPKLLDATDLNGDGSPDITALLDSNDVTILMNKLVLAVPVQFSASSYNALEDDGSVTVAVTRTAGINTPVSVDYQIDAGTATPDTDYSVAAATDTLTFGAGETSKTLTVNIIDDLEMEPTETINFTLTNPAGPAVLGARSTAVLNIADDEPRFSKAAYDTVEGAGIATITVTRPGKAGQPVSAAYLTGDGTARAGQDYTAASGTLNFAKSEKSKTFTVPITDDSFAEMAETLNLYLQLAGGESPPAYSPCAVLNITDNDIPLQKKNITGADWNDLEGMASGDFNRDGKTDLAVINGNQVQVWLAGDKGQFAAAGVYDLGTDPKQVIAADIDGDGELDLAAANNGSGNVTVLWGKGDGTFQDPLNIDAGASPNSLAVGDFNGDKRLDLAVARTDNYTSPDYGNYISILLNNGNTFSLSKFDTGQYNLRIAAGDFNGDGKTDLLTSNNWSTIMIAKGYGNGTFDITSVYTGGEDVQDVADADFNGDHIDDIAVLKKQGTNRLSIFLGNTSANYQSSASYNVGSPARMGAVDLNTDGKQDLALVGSDGQVAVLLGKGDGTFLAAQSTIDAVGTDPRGIASGDYDANGNRDLAVLSAGTKDLSVLLSGVSGILDFSAASYSAGEDEGKAVITVNRTAGTIGAVTVDYVVGADGDTATAGDDYTRDYSGSSGTLTLADGVPSASFEVDITDDDLLETEEKITLTLSSPTGGAVLGPQQTATLTILDNERGGQLEFKQAGDVVKEDAGTVTVAVYRTGGSDGAVDVDYKIENGTAYRETDYTSEAGGTLHFDQGGTTATITLTVIDDTQPEEDETINITLLNPLSPATLGPASSLELTILDNDERIFKLPADYTISSVPRNAAAGDFNGDGQTDLAVVSAGTQDLSVLLAGPGGALMDAVNYQLGLNPTGLATGDVDGDGLTDLVASDPAAQAVSVLLGKGDGTFHSSAMYNLSIAPNSIAAWDLNKDGRSDLAAVDDAASGHLWTLLAGTGGTFGAVNKTFDQNSSWYGIGSRPHSLDVVNNIIAVANQASDDISLVSPGITGPVWGRYPVTSPVDLLFGYYDSDPYLDLAVVNNSGSVVTVFSRVESVDHTTQTFNVGKNPASIAPGFFNGDNRTDLAIANSGSNNVSLLMSNGSSDFDNPYNIYAGEKPVKVLAGDFDGNGRLDLAVTHLDTGVISILLGSSEQGQFNFDRSDYSVNEDEQKATVNVKRSGVTYNRATVDYAISLGGTATAGTDYTEKAGTLTFNPGEISKTFTLEILDDNLSEPDETVNLELINPSGGLPGPQGTAVLTITDKPRVGFEQAEYLAPEDSTLAVTVKRAGGGENMGAAAVDYEVAAITATAGEDYNLENGTVQFAEGETSQIIEIPIIKDQEDDDNEQFRITLKNPTGSGLLGSPVSTTVTIGDDNGPGMLQFSQASYTVYEAAGKVDVTVTRTGGTDGAVTVNWGVNEGTARGTTPYWYDGTDTWDYLYQPQEMTLSFAPGEKSKTFSIGILQDSKAEGEQDFHLSLAAPTGGAKLGPQSTADVIIKDDQISFKQDYYPASGDWHLLYGVDVTLVRDDSTGKISINIVDDLGKILKRVDFQPGEAEKTVQIDSGSGSPNTKRNSGINLATFPEGGAEANPLKNEAVVSLEYKPCQGHISFPYNVVTVNEDVGTGNILVRRKIEGQGGDKQVSVKYSILGITAEPGVDYQDVSGTLVFAPGETEKYISIPVIDDKIIDMDESLSIVLSDPTGGAYLGSYWEANSAVNLKIKDNEDPGTLFAHLPAPQHNNKEIQFDAANLGLPPGADYQYRWDFGDGTTGSGVSFAHAFATARKTSYYSESTWSYVTQYQPYTVALDVLDAAGNQVRRLTKPVSVVDDLPVEQWVMQTEPSTLTRLRPGESVTWTLTMTNNGIPVAGAAVDVYDDMNGTGKVTTLTTDPAGKAAFTKSIPTSVSSSQWGQHLVTFRHGTMEKRASYLLYNSNGVLSGEVRDSASGTPLRGVQVRISRDNQNPLTAITDADGKYRFDGLQVDGQDYVLQASLYSYVSRTVSLPLRAVNTQEDFTLRSDPQVNNPEILTLDIHRSYYTEDDYNNWLQDKENRQLNQRENIVHIHPDEGETARTRFIYEKDVNYNQKKDGEKIVASNMTIFTIGTQWHGREKGNIRVMVYGSDGNLKQVVEQNYLDFITAADEIFPLFIAGPGKIQFYDGGSRYDYPYHDNVIWSYDVNSPGSANDYTANIFKLDQPLVAGDTLKVQAVDARGNASETIDTGIEVVKDPPVTSGPMDVAPEMATPPPPPDIPFLKDMGAFDFSLKGLATTMNYNRDAGVLTLQLGNDTGDSIGKKLADLKDKLKELGKSPKLSGFDGSVYTVVGGQMRWKWTWTAETNSGEWKYMGGTLTFAVVSELGYTYIYLTPIAVPVYVDGRVGGSLQTKFDFNYEEINGKQVRETSAIIEPMAYARIAAGVGIPQLLGGEVFGRVDGHLVFKMAFEQANSGKGYDFEVSAGHRLNLLVWSTGDVKDLKYNWQSDNWDEIYNGFDVINFSDAKYSVNEDGTKVTVTVNRTGITDAVQLGYIVGDKDDTAVAGQDYTKPYSGQSGALTFPKDVKTATFDINIADNTLEDGDKEVTLSLLEPSSGDAVLGVQRTATLTIVDNETVHPQSFKAFAAETRETEPGQVGQEDPMVTQTLGDLKPLPRDYLDSTSSWMPGNPGAKAGHGIFRAMAEEGSEGGETMMQSGVYQFSEPKLVVSGNKKYMVWLTDDSNRSAENRTAAAYSVFSGASWSAPAIISDDGTADFYPQVAGLESGAVTAWINNKDQLDAGAGPADSLPLAEIAVANYDSSSGTWSAAHNLTDDSYYDNKPALASAGNKAMLVWVKNAMDEYNSPETLNRALLFDPGNTNLMFATWDGTSWSNAQVATYGAGAVINGSLAYDGDKATYVYIVDNDMDLATSDDWEMYAITYDPAGGRWSEPVRLSDNNVAEASPQVVYENGSPMIFWLQDNQIFYRLGLTQQAPRVAANSAASGTFDLAMNDQGTLALIWGEATGGAQEIYASIYDQKYDKWSAKLKITNSGGIKRSVDAALDSEGKLWAVYNRVNMIEDDDGVELGNTDLMLANKPINHDLAVTGNNITFSVENPAPGSPVTVTALITNAGQWAEKDVKVAFYDGDPSGAGKAIGTKVITDVIAAQSKAQASVSWNVPAGFNTHELFVVADPDHQIVDRNWTNNTASISVVKPDLVVTESRRQLVGINKYRFTVAVANQGYLAVPGARVTLLKDAADGQEILSRDIGELKPGDAWEETLEWEFTSADFTGGLATLYARVSSAAEEAQTDNNVISMIIRQPAIKLGIPVTGLSLYKDDLKLAPGDQEYLVGIIQPLDASNRQVAWQSKQEAVVTVNSEGQVTAISYGTAEITATTADGAKTATATVRVLPPPVITLQGEETINLVTGQSFVDPGAKALDSDGKTDISDRITVSTTSIDTTKPGQQTVTYYLTSAAGFAAQSVTRTVKVSPGAVTGSGEVRSLTVYGVTPMATLKLYDNRDVLLATIQSGSATYRFAGVEPGSGYYVTQTVEGMESTRSNTVTVLAQQQEPGPGPGDSDTGGSRRGTQPGPAQEKITEDNLTQTVTTGADGKRKAAFVLKDDAVGIIQGLKERGETRLDINLEQLTNTNIVDLTVPAGVLKEANGLALRASTGQTTIELPQALVQTLAKMNEGLTITVQAGDAHQVAEQMLDVAEGAGARIVGQPTEISTSIRGNTEVTIPLQGAVLPVDQVQREQFLRSLAVLAIHGQGDTQVIKGTVVYNADGQPTGMKFTVDRFSTFAVIQLNAVLITDISSHWAEQSIRKLVALGAITGYPDGTFKPNNNITRAEFTTVLVKALDLTMQEGKVFADTAGHWARDYIGAAAANGIVLGYDDTHFGPDDLITRQEMAVMVARAIGLETVSTGLEFTDSADLAGWAREAVNAAAAGGVLFGYPDQSFRPLANTTRAEAATVLLRASEWNLEENNE